MNTDQTRKNLARAICDALANRDRAKLLLLFTKIDFHRLNLQEICNLQTDDGKSPIRYAIIKANGDPDMLKQMREKGIRLDVEMGPERMSALHLAITAQDRKILKYLLNEGNIKVNITDCEGESILHYAVKSRSLDICRIVLKSGININKQDRCGRTALHTIMGLMISNPIEKGDLLCKSGANPNIQDNEGNTPLHMLLKRKCTDQLDILRILMKHDAHTGAKNKDGFTAQELYESNTDHSETEKEGILTALATGSRHHSVSEGAQAPKPRRTSSIGNFFRKSISHLTRRISTSQGLGQNNTDDQVDGEEPEEIQEDEPFPDLETRLRLVKAFAGTQSDQQNIDDDNCSSEDDSMEDGSLPRSGSSSYRGGDVTEDDDFGDNGSVLSSCATSRKSSFNSVGLLAANRSSDLFGNRKSSYGSQCSETDSLQVPGETTKWTIDEENNDPSYRNSGDNGDGKEENEERDRAELAKVAAISIVAGVDTAVESMNGKLAAEDSPGIRKKSPKISITLNGEDYLHTGETDDEKVSDTQPPYEDESGDDAMSPLQKDKVSTATLVNSASLSIKRSRAGTLTGIPSHSSEFSEDSKEDYQEEEEESPFLQLKSKSEPESISYLKTCLQDGYRLEEFRSQRKSETLLHVAVRKNYITLAEFLIDRGLEVNAADKAGQTSLHIAAKIGKLAMVKLLVSNGASIERMTLHSQSSALDIAVLSDNIPVIEYLLSKDTLSAYVVESALNILVGKRRANEVTKLFVKHIDNRVRDTDLEIHLVIPLAAQRQHWRVLNFITNERRRHHCLLELDKRDESGYAAVHYCAMTNSLIPLQRLWKAGASISRKSKTSDDWETEREVRTVRSIAKRNKFLDMVKFADTAMRQRRKSSGDMLGIPRR